MTLLFFPGLKQTVLEWQARVLTASGRSMVRSTPKDPQDLLDIQLRIQRILPRCQKAVVGINGVGSGVIVSRRGWILTASHVLAPEDQRRTPRRGMDVEIRLHSGQKIFGKVHDADARNDIALVRFRPESADAALVAVPPGEAFETSQWCLALGHPGGFDSKRGSVLRLGRLIRVNPVQLQSDCALLGGDSGGPLFDLQGRVIGIHSKISTALESNFHVPVASMVQRWPFLPFERPPLEISQLPERSGRLALNRGEGAF